jgi:phosphoglycerate dehydrogenase-like enzyme
LTTKVLIVFHHKFEYWDVPLWFVDRLRTQFPQLEVVRLSTYDRAEEEIRDAEVVITWSLRPEQAKAAQKLRWLHSPSAAVHQLLFPELANRDIIITNGSEVHGPVVGETIVAMILALAKKFHQAARFQQKHQWGQEEMWYSQPHPREVEGATLGLLGLGSIGRTAARLAAGLGMRVIAVRANPEKGKPEGVAEVFPPAQLDTLLAQSDYVALAVPVTSVTNALINATRLAKMKPDACLINVGRGQSIDEAALVEALRTKKIGGAALDVFIEEPLPPDSPLWDLENVLITPHTSGLTEKQWERQYTLVAENMRRYLNHEPLLAVVDKQKGY